MAANAVIMFSVMAAITGVQMVRGSGVFQLSIDRLINERGLDSKGSCCSGEGNGRVSCNQPCQTWFKVCLTHYQYPLRENPKCTFASRQTPVIGQNSFNPKDTEYFRKDPFEMKFAFTWPGSFSLLIDVYHGDPSEDPLSGDNTNVLNGRSTSVNIVSLHYHGQVLSGEGWTKKVFRHSDKQLHYSFRVKCDDLYYGDGCSAYCRAKDNTFGHYTCDAGGRIVCMEGWTGSEEGRECSKPICSIGCHAEHGSCDQPNQCKCQNGWKGPNCTECVTFPGCDHGSCDKAYQCTCDSGWGGQFCTLDLNYCTNHKPCKNNAICKNVGQGSYKCLCPAGFQGKDCEIDTDDCAEDPCKNGARCVDEINGYRCECTSDFFGINCEKTELTCADSPCKNGASCEDLEWQYVCKCPDNYLGVNCEKIKNQCLSMPCANGGVCISNDEGYTCDCPSGFTGSTCLDLDFCSDDPCKNGGTCGNNVNKKSGFECSCLFGFEGETCDKDIDECENNPCVNGGTCHNLKSSFECFCPPGYTGQLCHTYSQNTHDSLRASDKKTNIFIVSDQDLGDLSTTHWIIICLGAGFLVVVAIVIGGVVTYFRCVKSMDSEYRKARQTSRQSDMSLPMAGANETHISEVTIVRPNHKRKPKILLDKAPPKVPGEAVKKLPLVSSPYAVEMPGSSSTLSFTASIDGDITVGPNRSKLASSSSHISRVSSQSCKRLEQSRRYRTQSDCKDKSNSVHCHSSRLSAEYDRSAVNAPLLHNSPSMYLPSYEEACEDNLLNPRNPRRPVSHKHNDVL